MKFRIRRLLALALASVLLLSGVSVIADTDVSPEFSLDGALTLDALMEAAGDDGMDAWAILNAPVADEQEGGCRVTYLGLDGEVLLQETHPAGSYLAAPAEVSAGRRGYTFTGWDTAFPVANLRSDLTVTALYEAWPVATFAMWADGVKTVLHTEAFAPGSEVSYGGDMPAREGFTFEGWRPALDGATIRRNTEYTAQFSGTDIYKLTVYYLHADGTAAAQPEVRTLLYGDSYTVVSPEVMGFLPDEVSISGVAGGDSAEIEHTVTYAASTGIPYSVSHHLRKVGRPLDDEDFYNPDDYDLADTETFAAMEGAIVTVEPGVYEGFTLHNQAKSYRVAADGSTEIHLYYTRNVYSIEFDTDGGTFVNPLVGEYGMPIAADSVQPPVKNGYAFTGWDEALPQTMPAQNTVRTAVWEAGKATYKVALWTQNADDDGYTYHDVVDMPATAVGSLIDPDKLPLPSIQFFTYDPVKTAENTWHVEGDGSTIVRAYYSRNAYTVYFKIPVSSVGTVNKKEVTYPGSAMVVDGKRYEPGGSEMYSFTARYDQDISGIWPTAANFPDITSSSMFVSWKLPNKSTTFTSKRLTLASDLFYEDESKGDFIMTAVFGKAYHTALHYMVESLTQSEGGGRHKYGTRWFDEDPFVSQTLYGASSTADGWSLKEITGLTKHATNGVATPNTDPYYNSTADVNVNLYYLRTEYKLQFYNQNEPVVVSKPIKFGASIADAYRTPSEPGNLAGRGYTFGGWYGEASCADESYIDWDTKTMPAGNLALFAKWTPPSFDVVCVAEDGYRETQSVIENAYASAPEVEPVRNGFAFLGWYIEGTRVPFHFEKQKITRDFTLVALWEPRTDIEYDVHYLHGEDAVAPARHVGDQRTGDTITEDGPVVEGYLVDYRSKSLALQGSGNVLTFQYVPFDAIDYTVEYRELNADGTAGDEIVPAETRTYTGRMPFVTEAAKRISGYTPERWNEQRILTANPSDNTIVFLYTPNVGATYTIVTWRENPDGTYAEDGRETVGPVPVGSYVNAEALLGELPEGFVIDEDGSRLSGYVENGNGLELVVRLAREEYTVLYELGGDLPDGVTMAGRKRVYTVGESVALPPPPATPDSHTFGGWTLPEGLELREDGSFEMPAQDVTITGDYTARGLTIAFGEGEHGGLDGDLLYEDIPWGAPWDEIIEALPVPVPEDGYFFLGWDADFPDAIWEDLTITPLFAQVMEIELVANGGEVVYNGGEQSVEGFTIEGLEGSGYDPQALSFEGLTAGGCGTDAGEYAALFDTDGEVRVLYAGEADAARFLKNGDDITNRFTVSGYVEGMFTIAPRPVTLWAEALSETAGDLRAQVVVEAGTEATGLVAADDLGELTFRVETPGGEGAPLKVGDTVWLHPVFEENPNYAVTAEALELVVKGEIRYEANYPSGEEGRYTQPGQLALGEEAVLMDAAEMGFAADGYTFAGWALSPEGEVAFAPGDALEMGGESPQLYAVWQVNATPTPEPTASPTASPSPTATASPAPTATESPTASPAPENPAAKATEAPEENEKTQYALTVRYVLADKGTSISAPSLQKLEAGEAYSVQPMESSLFEASQPVLEGVMPAENLTITFEYALKDSGHAAELLEAYDPSDPPAEIVAAQSRTAPSVFVVASEDIPQHTSMSSRNLGDCGF